MGAFKVLQIPYSALERQNEQWITAASMKDIGTVIRGGVAKGEPGQSGVNRPDAWAVYEQAKLDVVKPQTESRTSFMLRFTLSHPDVHTTIVGTLNPEHLKANAEAASRGPLPPNVYAEARKLLAAAGQVPATTG